MQPRSILLLCETLTVGGAETFVLRLAKALQLAGHSPIIGVIRGDLVDEALVCSIAPSVRVERFRTGWLRWLQRIDGALFHIGSGMSLLRRLQGRWLLELLRSTPVRVVHSHLITSDLVAAAACHISGIPFVTTMHGDYLAFEPTAGNRAARIVNFQSAVARIQESVWAVVCIAEQQRTQMARLMPERERSGRVRKIYNGYGAPLAGAGNQLPPAALSQIPSRDLVIGMVARGLREKGWDVLISAFRRLGLDGSWLVLVGEGPRIAELREGMSDKNIIFSGAVTDPLRYVARFDIACLPSYFRSESLPTVVIEYLYAGKPVVASDVGEIARMLRSRSDDPAGMTIAIGQPEEMVVEMTDCLHRLCSDTQLRARMGVAARDAFAPFEMERCMSDYLSLYEEAIGE